MNPAFTYTLKVTVVLKRPTIWRRIAVPSDIKLPRLHAVIRIALGSCGSAQHFFIDQAKTVYAHPAWDDLPKIQPAKMAALASLLKNPGDTVSYFCGDEEEWEHTVELIRISKMPDVGARSAVCLGGKGARLEHRSPRAAPFRVAAVNRELRAVRV
jgi:hypothetical protein